MSFLCTNLTYFICSILLHFTNHSSINLKHPSNLSIHQNHPNQKFIMSIHQIHTLIHQFHQLTPSIKSIHHLINPLTPLEKYIECILLNYLKIPSTDSTHDLNPYDASQSSNQPINLNHH